MNKKLLAIALSAATFAANSASAQEVKWIVAPYLWLPSIGADVNNIQIGPCNTCSTSNTSKVVDSLKMGFLLHTEAQSSKWGMMNEISYLNLGGSHSFTTQNPAFDNYTLNSDSDLKVLLVDLVATYKLGDNNTATTGFAPYAGIRYLGAQLDGKLALTSPPPLSVTNQIDGTILDENYTDFLIGARYGVPLSDKWELAFRGDYSFGSTNGTWLLSANVLYKTNSGAWAFGYRYMGADLPGPNETTVDLSLYGFQVGYAFIF